MVPPNRDRDPRLARGWPRAPSYHPEVHSGAVGSSSSGPVSGFTERAEAWEKVPSGSSSSTREWSGLAGLRVIP